MQTANSKKPLSLAISNQKILAAAALGIPQLAFGQTSTVELEEIVVTAQKREASLQDTAVSLQVLGSKELQQKNIKGFDDYIENLPTVSYTQSRPGIAQVYMRGIASGGDGNHSGSMPSVGVYVDEQPVTTINQVLDIHAYDLARIETLSGPQGTLFGSSSQSGTLRILTNKPVIGEFEAGYDLGLNTVEHGDMGYSGEGFINIPMGDAMALRAVAWHDVAGGYIDNVEDSITYAASGITRTNSDVVEKDFNDTTTSGMRALLKIDLSDNWTVTPGIMYQDMHSNGVFDHDPIQVGDLQTREYFDTWYDENWYQASLTVNGKIGSLDVVYAGAYLDRDVDSQYDYTGYSEYLEALYGYYGYYCLYYDAMGGCADPSQYVDGDETFERTSHEIRISTDPDKPIRAIAGFFYQDATHDFDLQWVVPDMDPASSVIQGGVTTWQTKQVREDSDWAVFGELSWDITESFTAMIGARKYEYDNKLYGFNGFLGHCTGYYDANGDFVEDRVNGTPQYPCFDTMILDDVQKNDDVIYKANLQWTVNDNVMLYTTYSEGYRPGGVNRARVPGIPKYVEDFTKNYEFGWKTTAMDNRLRFNGSAYRIDWEDFQYAILDFSVSNLTIIRNAGQAQVNGVEFDTEFAATEGLTLSFSGSINDGELVDAIYTGGDLLAPAGTKMPLTPKGQFAAAARYETRIGCYDTHWQATLSHTGKRWSSLENDTKVRMPSYTLLNLAAGFGSDNWNAEVYLSNATDERAVLADNWPGYPSDIDTTQNTNRPRTLGVRFGQRF